MDAMNKRNARLRGHISVFAFPEWKGQKSTPELEYRWEPYNNVWAKSAFEANFEIEASGDSELFQSDRKMESEIENREKENLRKFFTKENIRGAVAAAMVAECEITSQIGEESRHCYRKILDLKPEEIWEDDYGYHEIYEFIYWFFQIYDKLTEKLEQKTGVAMRHGPVPLVPLWRPDSMATAFRLLTEYVRSAQC